MAEKAPKRKAKPKREPQSVLGTLPASRPERLGRPRAGGVSRARPSTPGTAGAPAAKKRAPTGKRAAAKRAATAPARTAADPPSVRPTPVRPAAAPLRRAQAAAPPPPPKLGAPKGSELVSTTIRAAGELAQIGLTVGGQVLKRTIDRIPRP
jgi:hypothetical protein